jgi:DNA-binding MarR family transcriptional regulator
VQRLEDKEDSRRHRVRLTGKGTRQLEVSDRELVSEMKSFLARAQRARIPSIKSIAAEGHPRCMMSASFPPHRPPIGAGIPH